MEAHTIAIEANARSSLLRHSPALILLIVAIADIQRWADPDLWGHVAFGRAMLATHHLAFHDPYSYSAPGHLWLNHEWLSELLMAAVYHFGGVVGLKVMKFALCGAIFIGLATALMETDSPMTLQIAILLAAAVAIAPQLQFRPQLFTFAMMSALLALLTRFTYRGSAPLAFAIPILWLWANLHGGFIVGLATLAIFASVRTITDLRGGRGMRVGLRLFKILVASMVATVLTPYGLGTWQAVTHAMANPRTREVIVDWQPMVTSIRGAWHQNPAGALPGLIELTMFGAFALALLLAPRRADSALAAIAIVMIAASFAAMRNLPVAVVASVSPLARHWSGLLNAAHERRSSRESQFVLGAVAGIILIMTGLFSSRLRAGEPMPKGAVDLMAAHNLHGNILSTFNWGEYVIWHMAPRSKVFIDGRYDTVYPLPVIDDYLTFHFDQPGASRVLREYPHDFVLVGRHDESALAAVAAMPEWKPIYRDATCILFARNIEAAKISLLEVPPQRTQPSFFP